MCVCARSTRGPRLVFLIDLAQDLSDLQDNSKLNRCWWRWRDGKQDAQEEKKGRKLKIDSRESGAGTLTVRTAEIVKLHQSLCVSVSLIESPAVIQYRSTNWEANWIIQTCHFH